MHGARRQSGMQSPNPVCEFGILNAEQIPTAARILPKRAALSKAAQQPVGSFNSALRDLDCSAQLGQDHVISRLTRSQIEEVSIDPVASNGRRAIQQQVIELVA